MLRAMTCGDSQAQWVNSIVGSTWTGTMDAGTASPQSVALVCLALDSIAVLTVGAVPLVGVWQFNADNLTFDITASTEGIEYAGAVSATTCASSKVSVADGVLGDAFNNGHPVTLTRIV